MSLVVNPYSYFTDTNGNALNGYLYVGEVGKNAENYPIAIFYDALFTTPAPNPLTISAGYIYNSGTIAQIYASVDYSIVVKKTDGSLVYSSLNETGMTNGAIANIDEMKDFVAPYNNYALNVLGNITEGDGEGGTFYYDANSTETADDINIIEPTSGSGRWIRVVPLYTQAYTIETVDDFDSIPSGYTTAIVKDIDRGGAFIWSSTGTANGGTVFAGATGYWNRQYSGAVNVKWFGAKGDFNTSTEYGTNDTNAIQNAIDYAASNSKNVFISKGNYKITSSLVISSGAHIEGEGAVLVNRCTNEPTIFIGESETVWNGHQTTVYNIQFLGDGGDGSQNHGVYVRATLVAIDNCRFYEHSGSGIFGKFAQYNKYTNNGFANNSRYGIEIYTDDYNSYLSGDLEISGNYENISNTLGGMYLEVSNSKIVKNTHTDLPTCLEVFGYGNTIDSNTFEATGTTTSTMLKITNYILPNTVTKNTFMGSSTKITPMNVVSGKCVVKNNIFNCSPTGTIAYITNTADNFNVSIEDNKFTDTTRKAITYAGLDKTIYSNRVDSIKSRTGAGPFFVTEPSVIKLPLKGIWELSVTTGGNNYDYINNRASRVFIVFYLNNQYTFDHVTGQKLTGNATNLDITSVDINGNVGIIAGNNINAPISFFVTARMIGASESYS